MLPNSSADNPPLSASFPGCEYCEELKMNLYPSWNAPRKQACWAQIEAICQKWILQSWNSAALIYFEKGVMNKVGRVQANLLRFMN